MTETSPLFSNPQALHLHKRILEIPTCGSEDAAVAELAAVVDLMGFDEYYYVGNFSTRSNNDIQRMFFSTPSTTAQRLRTVTDIDQDPVMQAVQVSIIPIICRGARLYLSSGDIDANLSVDNGIGDGVIFPIHTKSGRVSLLACFVQGPGSKVAAIITSSLGEGSLTAMCFHDAMTRIITKSDSTLEVRLTHREKECLRWIAHHKSNWDISRILGVSEHTIVYYVRRLMQKLNAQNRHEAVERARAYALI